MKKKNLKGQKMSSNNFKLYKSLGTLIRDYRQWRSLSQDKLAESIGVSVRELRRWEGNFQRARVDNLHDLSEFTGIPMQVCVALNADQPIWYSLRERGFGYSSIEVAQFAKFLQGKFYKYPQSDEGILVKNDQITKNNHFSVILSCHNDIYKTEKSLRKDVIKTAAMILSDLNRIVFDCWGHYVGHQICLPITTDVYEQLKQEKVAENYLTTARISDIVALHKGVFFVYSFFAASINVAYRIIINNLRYYDKIEQKENYMVVSEAATIEMKRTLEHLGMRAVTNRRDYTHNHAEKLPIMYEIEMDVLMRPFGPFQALGWIIEGYDRRLGAQNPIGETKQEDLLVIPTKKLKNRSYSNNSKSTRTMPSYNPLKGDNPLKGEISLKTDRQVFLRNPVYGRQENHNNPQKEELRQIKTCPNPKCTMHGVMGKGNIVFNGTRWTKERNSIRRFLCTECKKSFCSRAGSIFYGLRTPEDKLLTSIKLLVNGTPLRRVAETLEVKLDTVRQWLRVVSEQSGKIDAMLKKELGVSQTELDTLWTFVKGNSLRQRAILWKAQNKSHGTVF